MILKKTKKIKMQVLLMLINHAAYTKDAHIGATTKGFKTSTTWVDLLTESLQQKLHWDAYITRGAARIHFGSTSLLERVTCTGETLFYLVIETITCVQQKKV